MQWLWYGGSRWKKVICARLYRIVSVAQSNVTNFLHMVVALEKGKEKGESRRRRQ